jgi:hypothetical protein
MITSKVFRQRLSARGYPYWVLEDRVVPRIPDELLQCAVYLYHSQVDADRGAKVGGSRFLYGVESTRLPDIWHVYVVSNRHVVETNPFVRLNTVDGGTTTQLLPPAKSL